MSLPKPGFDTTPMATVSLTDEQADELLAAANKVLEVCTQDGPIWVPSHAVALANMVKDYLE